MSISDAQLAVVDLTDPTPFDRTPPADMAAEAAVLGAMLLLSFYQPLRLLVLSVLIRACCGHCGEARAQLMAGTHSACVCARVCVCVRACVRAHGRTAL